MNVKIPEIIESLNYRLNRLTAYRIIDTIQFTTDDISSDSAEWQDVRLPFNWDNRKDAWFRCEITVPEKIDEVEVAGSELNVKGQSVWANPVLNMHGQMFINGKMVLEAQNWIDLSFFNLITESARPGDRHLVTLRTFGKEGVVVFYSALPLIEVRYRKVDDIALRIDAFIQEIRFAGYLDGGNEILESCFTGVTGNIIKNMPLRELIAFIDNCESDLNELKKAAKAYTLNLVGYAHMDVNWLWPMEETIELCRSTASSVDKVMNAYPDLCYTQSQAFTYKAMEQHHPEIFSMIRKRIADGNWEPAAAAWVELDLNISAGEAITHQILHAKRYMIEKFGYEPKLFFSPDTFGHAWTLPQILKKSGVDYYYFMRSSKRENDVFWWTGPDGSKVLTFNSSYLGGLSPDLLVEVAKYYKNTFGINESMYVFGIGDHGGGPTFEDGRLVEQLNKCPAYPEIKYGTMQGYLENLEPDTLKLPEFRDEINFIFDGCYTTHWDTKVHNRQCERLLLESELMSSLALVYGGSYPDLRESWENTMTNQFHDILPGSGIGKTYDVPNAQAEEVERKCTAVIAEKLSFIAGRIGSGNSAEGKPIIVFNPLSWERTDPVRIKKFPGCPDHPAVYDGKGNRMPCQITGDEILFIGKDIPSMGHKLFYITGNNGDAAEEDGSTIVQENFVLENEVFKLTLDGMTGTVASLYDKREDRYVMKDRRDEGAYPENTFPVKIQSVDDVNIPATSLVRNNLLQVHFEEPHPMSAWTIGPIQKIEHLTETEKIEIAADGPAAGTVRVIKRFRQSRIIQEITVYRGIGRIDFHTTIEWNEKADNTTLSPMLKAGFTPILGNTKAVYEIPFGSIERVADGREVPALQWADLSDGEYGLSVLTDTKYGFDATGNTIRLTLIRTSYEPDPEPDCGTHSFTYSLYPHQGDCIKAQTVRRGYELNQQLIAAYTEPGNGGMQDGFPEEKAFVRLESPEENAVITCIKKAEDGGDIILRLYETKGLESEADLIFGFSVKTAEETDIIERPAGTAKIKPGETGRGDTKLSFTLKPYEIKTFRLGL